MGCAVSSPKPGAPLRSKHDVWPAARQYVSLKEYDGAEMAYVLDGDEKALIDRNIPRGPLFVLIHGITYSSFSMEGTAKFLGSKGQRSLRMDLFGRGASDLPVAKHDADFYSGQIMALLKALQLDAQPLVVVGHSMGGAVSVCFAERFPEHVMGLILVAPAGFVEDARMNCLRSCHCCGECLVGCCGVYLARTAPLNLVDALAKPEVAQMIRDNQSLAIEHNAGFHRAFLESVLHFPLGTLRGRVKRVGENAKLQNRVLLLWGESDGDGGTGVSYAGSRPYRDLIPSATFVSYPLWHHNIILEFPETVHADMWKFCAEKLAISQPRKSTDPGNALPNGHGNGGSPPAAGAAGAAGAAVSAAVPPVAVDEIKVSA